MCLLLSLWWWTSSNLNKTLIITHTFTFPWPEPLCCHIIELHFTFFNSRFILKGTNNRCRSADRGVRSEKASMFCCAERRRTLVGTKRRCVNTNLHPESKQMQEHERPTETLPFCRTLNNKPRRDRFDQMLPHNLCGSNWSEDVLINRGSNCSLWLALSLFTLQSEFLRGFVVLPQHDYERKTKFDSHHFMINNLLWEILGIPEKTHLFLWSNHLKILQLKSDEFFFKLQIHHFLLLKLESIKPQTHGGTWAHLPSLPFPPDLARSQWRANLRPSPLNVLGEGPDPSEQRSVLQTLRSPTCTGGGAGPNNASLSHLPPGSVFPGRALGVRTLLYAPVSSLDRVSTGPSAAQR